LSTSNAAGAGQNAPAGAPRRVSRRVSATLAAVLVTLLTGCGTLSSGGGGADCVVGGDPAACCPAGQVPIFVVQADGSFRFDRCVDEEAPLEDGNVGDGDAAGASACAPGGDPAACCPPGQVPVFLSQADGTLGFDHCVDESVPLQDGNVDPARQRQAGEPNDSFLLALPVYFAEGGVASLQGSVEEPGDLDVFNLGGLSAGDRIVVDVDAVSGGLDPSIALFDHHASLFMDNDDEDYAAGRTDAHVDQIVRHDGNPYYLVVGASAFAAQDTDRGNYVANIRIVRAQPVPQAERQVFFLDFEGGPVGPDNLLVDTVPPFSAAAISPVYAGQDEQIRTMIIQTVAENFAEYDVLVVTDAADLPVGEEYARVMLGGESNIAFGISEAVDHYNDNAADTAIVFTEAFQPRRFTTTPTADELGLAIGNIVSHEAGHLLGLNHVNDPSALMDAASPADVFLGDQDFTIAPLSEDILPIGNQDAPLLLDEIVGPAKRAAGSVVPAVLSRQRCIETGHSGVWCATCGRLVP